MANLKSWEYERSPGNTSIEIHKDLTHIITHHKEGDEYKTALAILASPFKEEALIMKAAPELLDFAQQFQSVAGALAMATDYIEGDSVKETTKTIIASLSMLADKAIKSTEDEQ